MVRLRSVTWIFDLPSVTADPNETNWGRLPTRTYAVIPITPMVPVPTVAVISVVIPYMVMTVMVVIAPMILVMIVAFRVALILTFGDRDRRLLRRRSLREIRAHLLPRK